MLRLWNGHTIILLEGQLQCREKNWRMDLPCKLGTDTQVGTLWKSHNNGADALVFSANNFALDNQLELFLFECCRS